MTKLKIFIVLKEKFLQINTSKCYNNYDSKYRVVIT